VVAGCTDDSQGGVGARAPAGGGAAAPAAGTVANVGVLPELAPPEPVAAPSQPAPSEPAPIEPSASEPESSAPATTIAEASVPASPARASSNVGTTEAELAPDESTAPGSSSPESARASTPGTMAPEHATPASPPSGSAAVDSAPFASAPPGSSAPSMRERWERFAATADDDTFAGGARAAELVDGNRVIMIGDSITESTSLRYGGAACERIVPNGWAVEIDAQTGRFADYGLTVLDERLDAGFDVAVVMLGNNYRSDPVEFEGQMREIVARLAPRPTILFTVTMYRPDRAEVNDIIYEIALDHQNVRVIDWSTETAARPELLAGDRLHLSGAGRTRFVELLAAELGPGPNGRGAGACLPTP
jgi:hypothetical protein